MRKKAILITAAFAAVTVGLTTAFASSTHRKARSTPARAAAGPPAFVAQVAMKIARMDHDQAATAQAVLTNRQAAVALESQDRIKENQDVYYVVLHGHFVDDMAFLPSGASPPTGNTIGITIDAQTQEILDFSISNKVPDIARLGRTVAVSIG
jgi:hypothetical protein